MTRTPQPGLSNDAPPEASRDAAKAAVDAAAGAHAADLQAREHPLDNVIWSALTTRHRDLAEGDDLARRYPAAIAPFAALPDAAPASYAALARRLPRGEPAALFTVQRLAPPDMFDIDQQTTIEQMVGPSTPGEADTRHIVPLGAADVEQMLALVALTQPGPFGPRTYELGSYIGVRVDGQLVAMAGERMRTDGYTEISAVCAHPAQRGRGYPRSLIVALSNAILARGERPFLHVFTHNVSALALYEKLGFTHRRTLQLTRLQRAA